MRFPYAIGLRAANDLIYSVGKLVKPLEANLHNGSRDFPGDKFRYKMKNFHSDSTRRMLFLNGMSCEIQYTFVFLFGSAIYLSAYGGTSFA